MDRIIKRAALVAAVLALGACAIVPTGGYYSGGYYSDGYYNDGYYGGGGYYSGGYYAAPAPVIVRPGAYWGPRHRAPGRRHWH